MRVFLGMILGAVLTVAAAYGYDTINANRDATAGIKPMVNWEVVSQNWHDLRASLHEMGTRVHDEWVKRMG